MQEAGSKHVVIAGGSGFLGLNLAAHLSERGYSVTILSRSRPRGPGDLTHAPWDGRPVGEWAQSLDGAAALVNLAGRTVDCVKTPGHCDEILRSRVESTRALGRALDGVAAPPPVWVQMSTAHLYGDPPSAVCDEDSAFGYGLAPEVGKAWEAACHGHGPAD
ncbi:MAG: NAD-dependent epimerase/dehydratase family protein, partial [Acidobacteriota bacterium]